MPDTHSATGRSAIVVGGGMTGMLAASVLARYADVTIIERDLLPEEPRPRKGLPQARHAHVLWSGGVKALEELLPGIVDQLVRRGARRTPVMADLVSKAPSGQWFRRFTHTRHVSLMCSRDLLDAVIRARVLEDDRITLRQETELLSLRGDARRVRAVRVRSAGTDSTLPADLVIDASGRGSRAPAWLRDLGLPPVAERTVDAGFGYASRIYRAPGTTADGFPIVNVQADPRQNPGRGGIITPVEGGRWLVTLAGTREGRPSADNAEFVPFALGLPHPVIGELLAGAEPLTDVVTTRSTANRRRYYERAARWPDGFAVLGEAVAGYNPVYGHGLSAAAQSVVVLRRVLERRDLRAPGTARRIQRGAARPVENAWNLAVGQDVFYPGAADEPPTRRERALAAFVDRAVDAGSRNPRALRILLDVMSMEKPPARLLMPDMLALVCFGRKKPPLTGPPLSRHEREAATP
ncbi:2-polyprenyl-6-methoxyphenol hydroxylase-like FAD-dependent oxidoreductase [Streptomyces sp. V3I8]|uniref:FAD-dependent oxidoreductase n=1 Tax=Streptomyces sp. V3I8 TaxID=3042279 RepID=UPI002785DC7A|nr:FAD-dependent monooxygenase [Streptomyces sp. V3I8]MDQ1034240.1 2-polyprenyl-6-methoxyphenol hydroxylase-like FAD-dependent oxidoreductase [Streptomyces sp. V3I8]